MTSLISPIGSQSFFQVRVIRSIDRPERAFGCFARTHPAEDMQRVIHAVVATQVLQGGLRFGICHDGLSFRKTVEGMFECRKRDLFCPNKAARTPASGAELRSSINWARP